MGDFFVIFPEAHDLVFEIGIGLGEDVLFEEFFVIGFGLDGGVEGSLDKEGAGSDFGGNKAIALLGGVILLVFEHGNYA